MGNKAYDDSLNTRTKWKNFDNLHPDYLYHYKHSIVTQERYRTEVSLFHARLECIEQFKDLW